MLRVSRGFREWVSLVSTGGIGTYKKDLGIEVVGVSGLSGIEYFKVVFKTIFRCEKIFTEKHMHIRVGSDQREE